MGRIVLLAVIALLPSLAPGRADLLSAEQVLSVPEITAYTVNANGDVAWVERQPYGWNVLVARHPEYKTRQLTNHSSDDGQELFLLGFTGAGDVLYRHGQWGLNVNHAIKAPPVQILLTSEKSATPRMVVADEANRWTAPAVISRRAAELLIAEGGRVHAQSLDREAERKLLFEVRGTVRSLVESPDGQRIAFVSDRSVYRRGKYSFIGVFDRRKRTIIYLQPGLGIDQDITWSPDSRRVAFVRFGYEPRTWRFADHRVGAPFSVIVADAGSGEGSAVFTSAPGYGARFHGFGASGYSGLGGSNNLLWLASDIIAFPYEKTGWKLLYGVPADGGSAALLTPGEFEVAGATLSADRSQVLYWANNEADRNRLDLYRVGAGLPPERLPVGRPGDTVAAVTGQPVTVAGDDILVLIAASAKLPSRLLVQHGSQEPIQISTGPSQPAAFLSGLSEPFVWHYRSLDGAPMTAIVYRPAEPLSIGAHPAVVWAHGGSREQIFPVWNPSHARDSIWRYLVSRGYVVIVPNYRSGTGFGLDFREPPSYGGRGAGEIQDFIAVTGQLTEAFPEVDPTRTFIIGVSYGGHIATNLLARSDAFASGVSLAGVGDWVVEMEKDFNEPLQFNIPQRMKLETLAFESSAISRIDEWGDEPVLFVHGDNDASAAMQQSLELHLALKRRGIRTETLIFPGEAHQFKTTAHLVQWFEAVERFLADTAAVPSR